MFYIAQRQRVPRMTLSDLIRHDGGIMEKLALLFYYSKKAQSLPCIEEVYVKT